MKDCIHDAGMKRANCENGISKCLPRPCRPCLACGCIVVKFLILETVIPLIIPWICFFGVCTSLCRLFHCPMFHDCLYSSLECCMETDDCVGLFQDVLFWKRYEKKNADTPLMPV